MASQVQICNLALSHLGVGKEIANLDTENSEAASACRRFYDLTLEAVLRDFNWPFATKIASLGLLEEDPNDEWAYSYQYPSDCLKIRRLLSGQRRDTPDTRTPYRIANGSAGYVLFTDLEDAQLEYTENITDPSYFPPDFVLALSYRLAGYIGPRVAGADPMKLAEKAMKMYLYELSIAQASAGKEEQPDVAADSEFERARL